MLKPQVHLPFSLPSSSLTTSQEFSTTKLRQFSLLQTSIPPISALWFSSAQEKGRDEELVLQTAWEVKSGDVNYQLILQNHSDKALPPQIHVETRREAMNTQSGLQLRICLKKVLPDEGRRNLLMHKYPPK